MTYAVFVIATTVVLPLISVVAELATQPGVAVLPLVAKWFVFWGAGVRVLAAGVSQMLRPGFTARDILGIADPAAQKIVAELGFANVSLGLAATLSLFVPALLPGAALVGGLYLGLAGIKHATNGSRNAKETLAMATDLVVAAAVLVGLAGVL